MRQTLAQKRLTGATCRFLGHQPNLVFIAIHLIPHHDLPYNNPRLINSHDKWIKHCFNVIIAGGKGTRFWPLSRAQRPKQLLKILSRKSLIDETAERVYGLGGRERTLVVTVAEQVGALRKELSRLAEEQFPCRAAREKYRALHRAGGVGSAAARSRRRDGRSSRRSLGSRRERRSSAL